MRTICNILLKLASKGGEKMKFYNVKTRQSVEVPDSEVEYVTMKNGKKAAKAVGTNPDGTKTNLFRIVGNK